MANVNKPLGLSPHSYLSGAKWNGQARTYFIPSTDGSAYAIGDPVVLAGSADANGVPTVALATAGGANLVLGPIVGMGGKVYGGAIGVNPISQDVTVIPATKTVGYYVLVADDPNIIFECQEDNAGTPLAATEVSLNVSLKAGTNNGYCSTWVIDNATEAATTALQLKLLGLVQRSDNAFGVAAKWLVLINNHSLRAPTAGV